MPQLEVATRLIVRARLRPHDVQCRAGEEFPPQHRVPAEGAEARRRVGEAEAVRRRRGGLHVVAPGRVAGDRAHVPDIHVKVKAPRTGELLERPVADRRDERLGVELEAQAGRERPVDADARRDLCLSQVPEHVAVAIRGGREAVGEGVDVLRRTGVPRDAGLDAE